MVRTALYAHLAMLSITADKIPEDYLMGEVYKHITSHEWEFKEGTGDEIVLVRAS